MSEQKVMNRWFVVFGAILVQMCLGAIYAWSVFTPELINAGWTNIQTMMAFSAGLVSYAVVMVIAGFQLDRFGPRFLAIAGGLVLGAGYILAGLFAGTNFWMIFLLIGIVGGSGIGIGYVVPISVGMKWFPDKKGLITGLAVAGFGFGATGWVKLAGSVGNLLQNYGLSTTFLIFGIAFAILVSIGGFFMVNPPEGWVPEGYTPEEGAGEDKKASDSGIKGLKILSFPQYYFMFFTFIFSAGAGLMVIGLIKPFGIEELSRGGFHPDNASAIAGTALAILSIANGLGRIIWGAIADRIGAKPSILIMVVLQAIMLVVFSFIAENEFLFYITAAAIGFNFGGNFALFPTLTAEIFGAENVGQNYPFIFLAYGVGGTLCPIAGGHLGDMGLFAHAFIIFASLCVVGIILTALIKKPEHSPA